jgi:hypothetical protein
VHSKFDIYALMCRINTTVCSVLEHNVYDFLLIVTFYIFCCQNVNWFTVTLYIFCCQNVNWFTVTFYIFCCQNVNWFTVTFYIFCCQNVNWFTVPFYIFCYQNVLSSLLKCLYQDRKVESERSFICVLGNRVCRFLRFFYWILEFLFIFSVTRTWTDLQLATASSTDKTSENQYIKRKWNNMKLKTYRTIGNSKIQ